MSIRDRTADLFFETLVTRFVHNIHWSDYSAAIQVWSIEVAMAKIKLPYTMYCPKCKTPLKIKKAELIGKRIDCPKCKKKIDVVTPDEDGYIPYGVEDEPEPEPEPEPTEEELLELELEEKKKKKEILVKRGKYVFSILWLLILLGIVFGVVYYFVYEQGYKKKALEKEKNKFGWVVPQREPNFPPRIAPVDWA